ncbi:MAG: metallophosphoesterase [Paenisporosarcina sp.]|nr:metallophosphoesterase [Paenisporosarcina sp.]
MNLLAFADIRTTLELPEVSPDIVLLLGDIPSKMVSRIDKKYDCRKLGVLGNHCHPSNFSDTSIINMHNHIMTFDGITFGGFEGSPHYKERPYGQHTESEAQAFSDQLSRTPVDILMTHSNPAYGDMDLDNAHRGFKAFTDIILYQQISHYFHGHLHDPFEKQFGKVYVHSVYPFKWIPNLEIPTQKGNEIYETT